MIAQSILKPVAVNIISSNLQQLLKNISIEDVKEYMPEALKYVEEEYKILEKNKKLTCREIRENNPNIKKAGIYVIKDSLILTILANSASLSWVAILKWIDENEHKIISSIVSAIFITSIGNDIVDIYAACLNAHQYDLYPGALQKEKIKSFLIPATKLTAKIFLPFLICKTAHFSVSCLKIKKDN